MNDDSARRLEGCKQRLNQAKGYLNVLNKAARLDSQNDSIGEGYAQLIEAVQCLVQETVQDVEAMQRKSLEGRSSGR